MSTVFELERLRALVERLQPLASMQRGDVIRADNWNLIVESMIELARAVTTLESEGDVPPHDHLGEVGLDWLDAKLRQLIERGPLTDPVASTRVIQMEQRTAQLSGDLASVGDTLKGIRERLDETITRDLVRESSMVKVTKKVDTIADTREDVFTLRQTMDTIRGDLSGALQLRKQLEVNGRPVDMQAFNGRVAELERMRERLTLPSGQLLDAITVEQRLQATENKFVTRDELGGILDNRRGQLSPDDIGRIEGSIGAKLTADLDDRIKKNDERTRADFNTRFADVDKLVARAVSDSITSAQKSIADTLRADFTKTMDDRTKNIQSEFDGRFKGLREELGLTLSRAVADLSDDFEGLRKEFPDLQKGIDRTESLALSSISELEKKFNAQIDAERTRTDSRFTAESAASDKRTQDRLTQSQKDADIRTQGAIDKAVKDSDARTQSVIAQSQKETDTRTQSTIDKALKDSDARTQSVIAQSQRESDNRTQGLIAQSQKDADTRTQSTIDKAIAGVTDSSRQIASQEVAAGIKKFEGTLDTRIQTGIRQSVDTSVNSALEKRLVDVEKNLRATVTDEVKRVVAESGGQRTVIGGTTTPGSDFTRISGIGTAFADRLQSKGIRTFTDLAALKPAELATILGRPESEVSGMIKEAARLARVG